MTVLEIIITVISIVLTLTIVGIGIAIKFIKNEKVKTKLAKIAHAATMINGYVKEADKLNKSGAAKKDIVVNLAKKANDDFNLGVDISKISDLIETSVQNLRGEQDAIKKN